MPAQNAPGNQAFPRTLEGFERRLRALETQQNYVLADPRTAGNEGDPANGNAVAVFGALQAVAGIPHEWGIAVYDHAKGVWCRLSCEAGGEGPPGPEGKAGAWTALTSVSASLSAIAEGEAPDVRTEGGGTRAFLRGLYEVTAEIAANKPLFTVPLAFRPKKAIFIPALVILGGATFTGQRFKVQTSGVVESDIALTKSTDLLLDGINWNLT
jgi:hypothetical protein